MKYGYVIGLLHELLVVKERQLREFDRPEDEDDKVFFRMCKAETAEHVGALRSAIEELRNK